MSSSIAVPQETDPVGATTPDAGTQPPAPVASPDDAATLEVPGHRLYLFAMGRFLSGFSPDERPDDDRPAS